MNEQAKVFLEALVEDDEMGAEFVKEVVGFARDHGYEVTAEDLTGPEGEIAEEVLGAVTGGFSNVHEDLVAKPSKKS